MDYIANCGVDKQISWAEDTPAPISKLYEGYIRARETTARRSALNKRDILKYDNPPFR